MSSRDTARSGSHAGEYDACLRLHELCEAAGASSEQVTALVQRGVLKPSGKSPRDWSFPHEAVFRLRTAMRLSGGESNPAGAAVMLELLDGLEQLRSTLGKP